MLLVIATATYTPIMYKTNSIKHTMAEVFNLKKIIVFLILYFLFWFGSAKADLPYLVPKCPNSKTFAETSINNKNELLMKLSELVTHSLSR